ncbi:MAG: HDIG domain-containing protein [Solirubrobacterales bacterium]|nr:HDIG domain-containing protein [Solirubrobacterales bacterium]MBV9944751.1 HDIG domain-containing protein [Solirubrobacterales bacterium]
MTISDPMEALVRVANEPAWLVGGAVRDRALGRPTDDYDVALEGDARRLARSLARCADAHVFALSEAFGVWRVVDRARRWQVDVLPLAGHSIEADLAGRDFTVNAIAEPLRGGPHVDPFGGLSDIRERKLRMVSTRAFADDPLRTLRLARLACELDFVADPNTVAAAAASAPALVQVAPERIFAELKRILASDRALQGLGLMDAVRATEVVLPELTAMRGVEQSPYHHLDVYGHTRSVLAETIALSLDPGRPLREHGDAVARFLAEPLADELTRGQALRFGALLHDVAKPATRRVTSEGRVTFIGHDAVGAEMAAVILGRLRASERLREHVAGLTRHHLRLGFLVHEMPLGRRTIYRYLRDAEPVQVDVTLLSVADRLATRGRGAQQAIARHLELARQLLGEALAWREGRPRPPLRGDEVARAVGVRPGRALGRILAELEEASFAGEITSREQAIARARELAGVSGVGER